ncbi:MAG: class F sortase [Chloroflexota bacterium]
MTTKTQLVLPQQPSKRRTRRGRLWLWTLAIVLALVVGAFLFGGDARGRLIASVSGAASPTPEAVVATTPSPVAVVTPVEALPSPTRSVQIAVSGPPYKGLPNNTRIKVPSLGIDAPVVPVGLTAEGEVQPPPSPDSVGWYNLSPVPGNPGNSILAGHVDWKDRAAVFWDLRKLKPGDIINMSSPDRLDVSFVVEWVERYKPEEAPIDRIFASLYEPALTVITCEGVFDPATRDYSLRLVVRARAR